MGAGEQRVKWGVEGGGQVVGGGSCEKMRGGGNWRQSRGVQRGRSMGWSVARRRGRRRSETKGIFETIEPFNSKSKGIR
jgi:hypothetical protein